MILDNVNSTSNPLPNENSNAVQPKIVGANTSKVNNSLPAPTDQLQKSFCIRPWSHTQINSNGNFVLCCNSQYNTHYNINTHSLKDYWDSPFLDKIRSKMLSGQLPSACAQCKRDEQIGDASLRQRSNFELNVDFENIEDTLDKIYSQRDLPTDINSVTSNLCNLKCLMCSGNYSSSLLVENTALKLETFDQKNYNSKPHAIAQLKAWLDTKPKILTCAGGEPLMEPQVRELLEYGVNNNLLQDTLIRIPTNGTKINQDWLEFLSRIPKLQIMFSVDGIGPVNDYIRFGSNWDELARAAVALKNLKNVELLINTTLQNLNVLDMANVITWTLEHDIFFNLKILENPSQLQYFNLPTPLLELARERMQIHAKFKNYFTSGDSLLEMIDFAIQQPPDINQWNHFVDYISIKDAHRKNSILNIIPELEPYWTDVH